MEYAHLALGTKRKIGEVASQGASSAREPEASALLAPYHPAETGAEPVQHPNKRLRRDIDVHVANTFTKIVKGWTEKDLKDIIIDIFHRVKAGEEISSFEWALWDAAQPRWWRSILANIVNSHEARCYYDDEEWRLLIVVSAYLSKYRGADAHQFPIPNEPGMAAANALGTILSSGEIGVDPVAAGARWLTRMRGRDDLTPLATALLGLLNNNAGRPRRRP